MLVVGSAGLGPCHAAQEMCTFVRFSAAVAVLHAGATGTRVVAMMEVEGGAELGRSYIVGHSHLSAQGRQVEQPGEATKVHGLTCR